MSKKEEILQVLKQFKNAYEKLEGTIRDKKASGLYTDIGFEKEKQALIQSVAPGIQNMHNQLIQLVDSGMSDLENKWRRVTTGKLSDAGYQIGLSNVLKMLELGAISEKQDIENIIQTYQEDYNAMSAISWMISNNQSEDVRSYATMIPKDNRNYTRNLIKKFRNNIDGVVTVYAVENSLSEETPGFSSLSLSLNGMMEFVNDRLGEDLNVQEQK
jgi:hypothetical protein